MVDERMMWNQLKQWIYPDKCMVCGEIIPAETPYVCSRCSTHILQANICQRCGKPYAIGDVCIYCEEQSEYPMQIKSLFPYRRLYKASVLRWKYTGIRKYAKGYGLLMATDIIGAHNLDIDYLIPIPIADKRYEHRGFNQAEDLARCISEHTGIEVLDLFKRTKHTKPQSSCNKSERQRNIRGNIAFLGEPEQLEGKNIAFIDDIYTTGSTVLECIRVMQASGVNKINQVYVLTVCLTM